MLFPNPRRPDPEPFQGHPRRVVAVGTALFLVALLALLPFRAELAEDDRDWLLWSCAAGIVLGLLGLLMTRRSPRSTEDSPAPLRNGSQPEPPVAQPNPAPGASQPDAAPQADSFPRPGQRPPRG